MWVSRKVLLSRGPDGPHDRVGGVDTLMCLLIARYCVS